MNRKDIKKVLDELTVDIDSITDKKAVAIIKVLINLVEMLAEENARLKETVQELKDEINVSFPYRRVNTKQHSSVDPNSVHQQTV